MISANLPIALDPPERSDVIIVGSGVAGLSAALALQGLRVTLLTKTQLGQGGSTPWAQGGVAVALSEEDSPAAHAEDTLAVSGGIGDREAIEVLTNEGPQRVRDLIALGAAFDRNESGELHLGREAAHSQRRILHAGGDATGAEIGRALTEAACSASWIHVEEQVFAQDLILDEGRVVGILGLGPKGEWRSWAAPAVILATGGIGQVFRYTTNPVEVTGDGLAMAARAGAVLADLEMVQFHPTALVAPTDPLPLLTEALRGEGATLVDETGNRFMVEEHPLAELAPRDIVARAIWRRRQGGTEVFLEGRTAIGERLPKRFPTVFARCAEVGIDPREDMMPVTPAVHYHMGGISVDLEGRSSIAGLWACGETSSTGVHGANRLASNSLLEGLVYGAEVADSIRRADPEAPESKTVWRVARAIAATYRRCRPEVDRTVRKRLRETTWDRVGLARSRESLLLAREQLSELDHVLGQSPWETANMLLVARLITEAALLREESRGAHFRTDFPLADASLARRFYWTQTELLEGSSKASRQRIESPS